MRVFGAVLEIVSFKFRRQSNIRDYNSPISDYLRVETTEDVVMDEASHICFITSISHD